MDGIEDTLSALFSSPESMAQLRRMAESLMGGGAAGEAAAAPPTQESGGEADPRILQLLTEVLRVYSAPSNTASLVRALRPWLRQDRAERLDKALRIARLTKAAGAVLPELGGLRL